MGLQPIVVGGERREENPRVLGLIQELFDKSPQRTENPAVRLRSLFGIANVPEKRRYGTC
jgi:hypothetical protein